MSETIHSMLRRCVGWDYSQPCMYMISIALADRRSQTLGSVVADTIGDDGTPTSAHCELTPLGKAVEECWEAIPRFYPQVQIIGKQVMPDHFHGILWVREPLGCHLGQVQCSRSYLRYKRVPKPGGGLKIARDASGEALIDLETPEYRTLRDVLLAAARHGSVLISPCISDGEKQIAREALNAGLPLVTMQNKGFAKLQKPSGRYFEACAAGRLLMLAPAAWPYTPAEKKMTRDDATAMNRLCQWLAGDGAATINYHGVTPANIDRFALAAATC